MAISGLLFGSPGTKSHLDVGATGRHRVNPREGGEATAPSVIREVQIIQRGKEMPPNGGIVLPENVHVKPFLSKG